MSAQTETDELEVWVDQDLCTGDGLCVQYAPEVFEFDIDGLAYVKDSAGELLQSPGLRTGVPERLRLEALLHMDIAEILPATTSLTVHLLGAVVAMLAVVAIGDYFFQYRTWYERQKMSLQEMKDEF